MADKIIRWCGIRAEQKTITSENGTQEIELFNYKIELNGITYNGSLDVVSLSILAHQNEIIF